VRDPDGAERPEDTDCDERCKIGAAHPTKP